jgi:hypothetical protein
MFVSKAGVVIHKSIIFFTRVRYPESDPDNLGKPYVHLTHPHPKKDGKNYWKSLVHAMSMQWRHSEVVGSCLSHKFETSLEKLARDKL